MHINVSSQHMSVHHNVHDYTKRQLTNIINKYFEHAISGHVNFAPVNTHIQCSISVNDGIKNHLLIFAQGLSDEIYNSFDITLAKLQKQLRKYRSKIKSHHNQIKVSDVEALNNATKYIMSPITEAEEGAEEEIQNNPLIIEERSITIPRLNVGEAVMQMDLQGLPALMFTNASTNKMNVVYYRKDGNISWIEAKD